MVDMLGLSRPVPKTISVMPAKTLHPVGMAIT
jgi:hypothetical protein